MWAIISCCRLDLGQTVDIIILPEEPLLLLLMSVRKFWLRGREGGGSSSSESVTMPNSVIAYLFSYLRCAADSRVEIATRGPACRFGISLMAGHRQCRTEFGIAGPMAMRVIVVLVSAWGVLLCDGCWLGWFRIYAGEGFLEKKNGICGEKTQTI